MTNGNPIRIACVSLIVALSVTQGVVRAAEATLEESIFLNNTATERAAVEKAYESLIKKQTDPDRALSIIAEVKAFHETFALPLETHDPEVLDARRAFKKAARDYLVYLDNEVATRTRAQKYEEAKQLKELRERIAAKAQTNTRSPYEWLSKDVVLKGTAKSEHENIITGNVDHANRNFKLTVLSSEKGVVQVEITSDDLTDRVTLQMKATTWLEGTYDQGESKGGTATIDTSLGYLRIQYWHGQHRAQIIIWP